MRVEGSGFMGWEIVVWRWELEKLVHTEDTEINHEIHEMLSREKNAKGTKCSDCFMVQRSAA